jgi:hypothetical protein
MRAVRLEPELGGRLRGWAARRRGRADASRCDRTGPEACQKTLTQAS